MTPADLAKGRALRDAEREELWQSRTTHALSDWLDRHCDDLLEAATELLSRAPMAADTLSLPQRRDACAWREDSDGAWDTECGGRWEFTDDGLKENNCWFCPHCGGTIAATSYVEQIDAEVEAEEASNG